MKNRHIDFCCLTIHLTARKDDDLRPFDADIYVWEFLGDDGIEPTKVGTLEGHVIPLYRYNKLVDMALAADDESAELFNLVNSVWDDSNGELREELNIDENGFNGLLCLEYIEIDESFRGWDIGLVALSEAIESLGGGMLCAVLYAENQKLRDYWSRIGFVENKLYPGFMVNDLTRPYPEPSVDGRTEKIA